MEIIKNYIDANRERFIEELFGLIRIPSVSASESSKPDMIRAAEYIRDMLITNGADRAEVYATAGNPIVYGEKTIDPALPTILVYGHYDVMPAEPLDKWVSPPFEPVIRDGKIFARGADDDKGQLFMHLKAFEMMMATGTLPCNAKFMIEGEEEAGSVNIAGFCSEYKDMLRSDVILVSDTTMISSDTPSVTSGLRGLSYIQIEVEGPDRDLHSGIYGGAVVNPCNVLCDIISGLKDKDGRITIPGFYDAVSVPSDAERAKMAERPFDPESYKKSVGVEALAGEKGFTTLESVGIRPTLDVNGIWGGYTGEGAKTILPSKASAKISMRLVPYQKAETIADMAINHIRSVAPAGVKIKAEYLHGGEAYVSPLDTPEYLAAERAYEEIFGKKPIPVRSGGSIPIISTFEKILGVKSILMGFGLEADAIHSPNESYPLENLFAGMRAIPLYYRYYTEMKGSGK
jgi:acetylornithine deacetylase/succinyl-diaminopimelate desuccinylase-like protein